MDDSLQDKDVNPQLVELLRKMSLEEIEIMKKNTKDEEKLMEIIYTLKMVPKLKYSIIYNYSDPIITKKAHQKLNWV